jgi:hypothetical protein
MGIPGIGSRDNADHLLSRMVRAGEITRRGIGRYGPPRRPPDVAQPITPAPITPAPPPPRNAPIPAAPGPRSEAALRDHFRHRSKLDPFRQALFGADEDGDRSSQRPAETMDVDTLCDETAVPEGEHDRRLATQATNSGARRKSGCSSTRPMVVIATDISSAVAPTDPSMHGRRRLDRSSFGLEIDRCQKRVDQGVCHPKRAKPRRAEA